MGGSSIGTAATSTSDATSHGSSQGTVSNSKDTACIASLCEWLETEAEIPPRRAAEYAAIIYDKGGEYKPSRIAERLRKNPGFLMSLGVDEAHNGYIVEKWAVSSSSRSHWLFYWKSFSTITY